MHADVNKRKLNRSSLWTNWCIVDNGTNTIICVIWALFPSHSTIIIDNNGCLMQFEAWKWRAANAVCYFIPQSQVSNGNSITESAQRFSSVALITLQRMQARSKLGKCVEDALHLLKVLQILTFSPRTTCAGLLFTISRCFYETCRVCTQEWVAAQMIAISRMVTSYDDA